MTIFLIALACYLVLSLASYTYHAFKDKTPISQTLGRLCFFIYVALTIVVIVGPFMGPANMTLKESWQVLMLTLFFWSVLSEILTLGFLHILPKSIFLKT